MHLAPPPSPKSAPSALARLLAALLLAAPSTVTAQEAPATQPAATQPTTQPAATQPATTRAATTRPRLIVPPGFTRIEIGSRRLLVRPEDEAWVREAVVAVKPATRPTTLPADLVTEINSRRDDLAARLSTDLGIPQGRVEDFVDDTLRLVLENFDKSNVASVAMVTSPEQLKALLKAGWQNPVMQYNRAADAVYFSEVLILADDPDAADALMPLIYGENLTPEQKRTRITEQLRGLDDTILRARSSRAQFLLQATLLRFIGNDVLSELPLPPDQEWFSAGITGVLTAKYTSLLSGVPRRAVIKAMTAEPPRGRGLSSRSIDLLRPVDPQHMRREMVLPYADALRRKSVRVIDDLILLHGDEVLPKLLASIREKKPDSAAELVNLIRDLTGTDLSRPLSAGN